MSSIKIVCNGCIRRFSLPPSFTFEKFKELVCQNAELPALSNLTFTFTHPSVGCLNVNDTDSLNRCLEVAASHNIVARLNVSVDGVPSSSPSDSRSIPAAAQALPVNNQSSSAQPSQVSLPVVVAAPAAGAANANAGASVGNDWDPSFDANAIVNDVIAQAGAFLEKGSSAAMSGLDGLLSQANSVNLANMFGLPTQQDAAQQAPATPSAQQQQPPVVVHAQPAQIEQQKQQPQVPQVPRLPDISGLLSSVMNAVQPQQQAPQAPQAQQTQSQQPQQQQPINIAQLLGSPFGLQQMMGLFAPPSAQNQQAGSSNNNSSNNNNNNNNNLANMAQIVQTLGPLLPQMMSMVVPIVQAATQQQQQQRPITAPSVASTPPFGSLGAMAQSLAQQALGTAPRPASAPVDASGEFSQQLATLSSMGFNDRFLNLRLLREANGDVGVVFGQLRRREEFAASLSK